jgi:hypothetical protein
MVAAYKQSRIQRDSEYLENQRVIQLQNLYQRQNIFITAEEHEIFAEEAHEVFLSNDANRCE